MRSAAERPRGSPWLRRVALATAIAAFPLVCFGGAVTTLRAGMAIDGWLILEPGRGDHFLLAYPVDKWFRDVGTFTEHTHRLLGTLVGTLAIVGALVAWRTGRGRATAVAALLAVCVQGTLGGLRVLENSPELAFLHGVLAQAVFALLAAHAIAASSPWSELARRPSPQASSLRSLALAAVAVVFAEVAIGAWLRHTGAALAMALHVLLVVGVVGVVLALARRAASVDAETGSRGPLARVRRNLVALLWCQVALGVLAAFSVFVLSGGFRGDVSTGEVIFATLHVAVGALLLVQCVGAAMWAHRLVEPVADASVPASTARHVEGVA